MTRCPARSAALALAALALSIGCTTPPAHDTESSIAQAAGLAAALEFRTEGGPLDEPDEQAAEPPGTLPLAGAVRRAVTTDPGIQAALARVRIALAEAGQARLLPNPVLSLAFRFPENSGKPVVEASLAQDLISILRIPRESSAADNRLRQAAADAVAVALDTAAEVQERYATIQALDELMPVLRKRQELLARLLSQERDKLAAGEGTRQGVATLDTQRIELEVEIADRERERRDERLRLARLIGQPSAAADWALDPWLPPRRSAAPEADWVDAALAHRPEVRASAWRLAALGDEVALARLLPFEGASAGAAAERDETWTAGPAAELPVPLFDTGRRRVDRAAAERVEARHQLVQTKRRVVEDVRRAYESLERHQANLERVRRELVPLQAQRRSLAEAAFRAGQSDITALFLAEQDLQAALAKAVELERETSISLIRLERAVGGTGVATAVGSAPQPPPDSHPDTRTR
jgi:outer membrane protein TolC